LAKTLVFLDVNDAVAHKDVRDRRADEWPVDTFNSIHDCHLLRSNACLPMHELPRHHDEGQARPNFGAIEVPEAAVAKNTWLFVFTSGLQQIRISRIKRKLFA
jgi:hypothetical protein